MNIDFLFYFGKNLNRYIPLPSWRRSGHSFPPLRAGLSMYLKRNLVPVASGALQFDQSPTIHGSGTVNNRYKNYQLVHN
jgi:hypothetical protein